MLIDPCGSNGNITPTQDNGGGIVKLLQESKEKGRLLKQEYEKKVDRALTIGREEERARLISLAKLKKRRREKREGGILRSRELQGSVLEKKIDDRNESERKLRGQLLRYMDNAEKKGREEKRLRMRECSEEKGSKREK